MTKVQKSPDNRFVMREHNSANELKIYSIFFGWRLRPHPPIKWSSKIVWLQAKILWHHSQNATKMIKDKMKYVKTNILFLPSSDANFVYYKSVFMYSHSSLWYKRWFRFVLYSWRSFTFVKRTLLSSGLLTKFFVYITQILRQQQLIILVPVCWKYAVSSVAI